MIAFPMLLVNPAKEAGIKVPPDLEAFEAELYPHFTVFGNLQLGRPMPSPNSHFNNAKIVAQFSDEDILTATVQDFIDKGWE